MKKKVSHIVSIVMGSKSDYSTMKFCEKVLKLLNISYEINIVSAHRTPERMFNYAKSAEERKLALLRELNSEARPENAEAIKKASNILYRR